MKLLNFSNSMFKWEEEKRLHFYGYFIDFRYKFKYWFYYPSSFYFGDVLKIKKLKADYRYWFINKFKQLKKDNKDETAEFQ